MNRRWLRRSTGTAPPLPYLGLLAAVYLVPGAVNARAACAEWLVAGVRTIEQSNGITVTANFSQQGATVGGTATWTQVVRDGRESYARPHDAGVAGTVEGHRFDVVMTWGNGSIGVYTGTIDARGFVTAGVNYDRHVPNTRVSWRNVEPFRCRPKPNVDQAPPAPIAKPKPVTANSVAKATAAATGGFARPRAPDVTRVTPETGGGAIPEAPAPAPPPAVPRHTLPFGDRDWLYGVDAGGAVVQYVDRPGAESSAPERRTLESLATVATGWKRITHVFPGWAGVGRSGAGFAVFALTADGALKWYRHGGFPDGEAYWAGPIDVATGWNEYSRIFAGGDGILYGIRPGGELVWHRYDDVASARTPPSWTGPLTVGTGWGDFVQVFSGGEGVVYAVRHDGTLLWYRHVSYQTGIDPPPTDPDAGARSGGVRTARWEGPKIVGSGWQQFRTIVSPGNGVIYAIDTNGDVQGYLHQGFRDGSATWQGPVRRGGGWSSYPIVFPLMRGTLGAQ